MNEAGSRGNHSSVIVTKLFELILGQPPSFGPRAETADSLKIKHVLQLFE